MRRLIILSFLCSIFFKSNGQGIQKEVPLGTNAAKFGYFEYLPPNYPTSGSFPLIVFLHGVGEKGNGTTDLYKVLKNGPPYQISIGAWPIKNPNGNYPSKEFIVISPQSSSGFPSPASIHEFIAFLKSYYKVDNDRIYLTGLSAGGISTWRYLATYNDQIAAAIPIAGNSNAYTSTLCTSKDTPVWAFHGDADGTVSVSGSITAINTLRSCPPAGTAPHLLTIYNGVGHNSWTNTYNLRYIDHAVVDPNYDSYSVSIYDWLLSHTRSNTLQVSLGSDKSITLPNNNISLTSTVTSTNPVTTYAWTKQSGPAATLVNANTSTLTANGMVEGTYMFRSTVSDNQGNTAYDEVTVNVLTGAANQAPLANAGVDKTVQLPTNSAVLSGTASDQDGAIVLISWTQQSGPVATLENKNSTNLTVKDLVQGTYVFRIFVKDDDGAAAYDDVTVTVVSGGENLAPMVNAGADKTIQLPTNSIVLSGTVNDPEGNIAVHRWIKQSGPSATLGDQYLTNLTITDLIQGTYVFRLFAKDNDGAAAYDDVTVSVLDASTGSNPIDLVGHWTLDQNADDCSGSNNHGININGAGYIGDCNEGSHALELNGINQYIELKKTNNLPSERSPRSMSLWAKTNDISNGFRWAAAYGKAQNSSAMFIGQKGPHLDGGGYGNDIYIEDFWKIGVWHHIVLTYDGTTAKMYADGIEVASERRDWPLILDKAYIGCQVHGKQYWNGHVDDVRIYGKTLNALEVQDLYNSTNNLSAQSRVSSANISSNALDQLSNDITVYPNPFKDRFSVRMSTVQAMQPGNQINFRLIDLMGNIVIDQEINNQNSFNFDLSELKSGTYIYLITSNNNVISKDRIIKMDPN
jgi:poly(3-hydroxybutyrate) depolymerase